MSAIVVNTWSDFITAIGTANAEVELPCDLVRTSDTVVNPNKLYVNSLGEVQTNVTNSDLPNLYENPFEFDLNVIHPEAFTSAIQIRCKSLKGNGATIKNISFSGSNGFRNNPPDQNNPNQIIQGLAIKNFSIVNGYLFYDDVLTYGIQINKSMFSGRIDAPGTYNYSFINTPYTKSYSCSFNLELAGKGNFHRRGQNRPFYQIYNCRVHLTGSPSLAENITAYNSYISGSINGSFTDTAGQYSVFDVESTAISGSGTLILANSDKCSSISGVTSVTTAQLHNAEELQRIGFPIQT